MAGLDNRSHKPRHADSVAAHQGGDRMPVMPRHLEVHRRRIFVAKVEDVADLDSPARASLVLGDPAPQRLVVSFVSCRICRAYLAEEAVKVALIAIIDV